MPKMTRIASLYSGPIELDEQAILSVICHSDLGQSETMSTPALANQATNQQHKRHRKENSAEEAASSNTRKRQKHEGGPKSAEFYEALEEELNAKSFDPVATDKTDIEGELRSGSSILVLESTPSKRSRCRALLCLRYN
jgi:hypothetical protein